MNATLKGGAMGVIVIIFLSFAMTPVICDSIQQKYPSVSCSVADNIDIFARIYLNIYALPFIILGYISGALIGRGIFLVRSKEKSEVEILLGKIEKRPPLYPWEARK